MLGHGEVAPRPRTCCGQSRGRESRSSWFPAQGFPSPSSPSGTFGMGRVFSLFHQLNNSLSAVSSRGESQGSQPPIPSLPPSLGKQLLGPFRDGWRRPRSQPPCWHQQQLQRRECPIPSPSKSCSPPRAARAALRDFFFPGQREPVPGLPHLGRSRSEVEAALSPSWPQPNAIRS